MPDDQLKREVLPAVKPPGLLHHVAAWATLLLAIGATWVGVVAAMAQVWPALEHSTVDIAASVADTLSQGETSDPVPLTTSIGIGGAAGDVSLIGGDATDYMPILTANHTRPYPMVLSTMSAPMPILTANHTRPYPMVLSTMSAPMNTIRLARGATIMGLAGGFDGRVEVVANASATEDIYLLSDDARALAEDRLRLLAGADAVLPPNTAVTLVYDARSNRWLEGAISGVTSP